MSTEIFIWILYSKRDRVRFVERGLMADEGKKEEEEAEKRRKWKTKRWERREWGEREKKRGKESDGITIIKNRGREICQRDKEHQEICSNAHLNLLPLTLLAQPPPDCTKHCLIPLLHALTRRRFRQTLFLETTTPAIFSRLPLLRQPVGPKREKWWFLVPRIKESTRAHSIFFFFYVCNFM